ncbi:uncharacterized protein [Temnothorax nylanderi]|uniref:uncharacterized protein n=1 Tax=Temnothorax nylanderi TaxID=102681 RepID=UPI003A8A806D
MMKANILIALTLSFAGYSLQQPSMKTVSIRSKEHEKIHDIKITNDAEIHKIQNCGNTEFVNLSGMYIRNIQNNVIQSDAIRHVSLHHNFFKKIPQNILNYVTYLSCFNLSRNSINLYKNNQIQHTYLQVLDLSYQTTSDVNAIPQTETFDEETEDMYKYMTFDSSNIKLPNLEYLDLSGNDISTLLWGFNKSFPKLVRLDLVNINAQELDPHFFYKIPSSLRVLHLENNHLRNLTLQNVAEITSLYLNGNPLEQLNINSTKLQTLSLSNCTKLSAAFFDTPYLEILDLSRNNLNNEIGVHYEMFRALRVLLLDYNKFSYIPTLNNVQWVKELSLCYNMIKHISPNNFKYLTSLNKLSLKGNRIDNLERETFSGLDKLEYLDLSENNLNHLPTDWASPLKNLKYLNVNSNKFASISEMGIYSIISLNHLFVRNNTFTKITTMEIEPLPDFITIFLV